ncbi:MAG: tRNA 2-thiouridine(34) synthase MnmA [Anaerolineae bacterium]|nr:tRNA 2-thiouridine(34) synthase MnmA [Anaerolineae bacterium]
MSGGVDSSVVTALLVEQGYDVAGVMMRLWAEEENRCCAPDAVEDARQVAAQLDIPFDVVDYQALFRSCVVDYFVAEYGRGRTPNPCLACNRQVRFGRLLAQVLASGAGYMATGHYARIDRAGGRYRLLKGVDRQKDQSYVLYMLGQEELAHLLFPLGGYTKAEVRAMARARGLPVAERDESMELCFVADDDYRRFLREHAPETIEPGPILDTAGREIGRHGGLPFYTIGQRRGLGIAAPDPLYVIGLDTARNALVVGTEGELGRRRLTAGQVSYVSGHPPDGPVCVEAKIRYRATLAPATWEALKGGRARVEFDTPLRDITPGQAVVAYQGDVVLGGGIIEG